MNAANLLSPEDIRRIRASADITEVVGNRVTLRKTGATYTGLCCFHQEKTPSLIVTPSRQRFQCFGCGVKGDVFQFVMLNEEATFREAALRLAHRAGIPVEGAGEKEGGTGSTTSRPKLIIKRPEPRPFHLPAGLHRGTMRELRTVAERRGLSAEGLELAGACGLLRFASWHGLPAWIVVDGQSVNAQARRMDGQRWGQIDAKAWTLPGSRASWPIGTREATDKPFVVVVEGGPDLLAAHHFIIAEGRDDDTAAVAILGALNDFPDDALKLLAGKRVRLFPHLDPAGQNAAVRWTEQLESAGCEVDAFSFAGLTRADGGAVKDLNDLANLDVDCFEAERAELSEVLPR